jgi:hypothetical protein
LACRWRISKSPWFPGVFEILIRCRYARHPRHLGSFDRHRRKPDRLKSRRTVAAYVPISRIPCIRGASKDSNFPPG